MKYKKININISPADDTAREIIIAQLSNIGYDSFMETEDGLEAYISEDDYRPLDEELLPFLIAPAYKFEISAEDLEEKNWNEEWEKNYFKPIVISDQCLVRSPFHEKPEITPRYEILIEPKMAFGTGYHETTTLMVQYLLETDSANTDVLDMGCGTGILGILAAMREAKNILGIDIDKWAVENALENIKINNISNMQVQMADASFLGKSRRYDIILANINRNILLEDMPRYDLTTKTGTQIFLSGFYREDLPKIDSVASQLNWQQISIKEQNNWVAVSYRKK
ncbi:50S ribosomal protein L11 methyltransferase [Marinilabilia salmonicolor]|uniref:Ribosomal protein L11 methyltransferase n=1 Tax=Marinilabilia salmonicolor TaxID=989 RepID=A0A368UL33_9BACT|nr:50S ribosomal protein L11 methyltransferase [Marinilabilia salmonicolor]RCW29446.1 ribosomal protein L11 methyltransferase [Marinilabilia salmonicolor]